MVKLRPGLRIGPFALMHELGGGGNAKVWRAGGDQELGEVAVKVLTRGGDEPRRRFIREVEVQMGPLRDHVGLLPVIKAAEPTDDIQWLAMPVAQPFSDMDFASMTIERRLGALRDIAYALKEIHQRGYAHRDVKPGNLYYFNSRYVIGDLGLIATPDPSDLTSPNRDLGPRYFLAPEMMAGTPVDATRADVYSFGKVLWTVLTSSRVPPPGHHAYAVEALRVSAYISHPTAPRLDALMERMSRFNASDRPTMDHVEDELRRLISPVEAPRSLPAPDLTDLRQQLSALNAPGREAKQARIHRREQAEELFEALRMQCDGVVAVLRQIDTNFSFDNSQGVDEAILQYTYSDRWGQPRNYEHGEGRTVAYQTDIRPPKGGRPAWRPDTLFSGCAVVCYTEGEVDLVAAHILGLSIAPGDSLNSRKVWRHKYRRLPLGSQAAFDACFELGQALIERVPDAVRSLLEAATAPPPEDESPRDGLPPRRQEGQ